MSTPKKKTPNPRRRDPDWIDPKSSFLISPEIKYAGTPLPRKASGEPYTVDERDVEES